MLCTAQCELGITTGKSESVWSNTAKVTSNVYRSGGRRIMRLEKSLCTSQREGAVSVWEARDSLRQSTSCISPQHGWAPASAAGLLGRDSVVAGIAWLEEAKHSLLLRRGCRRGQEVGRQRRPLATSSPCSQAAERVARRDSGCLTLRKQRLLHPLSARVRG